MDDMIENLINKVELREQSEKTQFISNENELVITNECKKLNESLQKLRNYRIANLSDTGNLPLMRRIAGRLRRRCVDLVGTNQAEFNTNVINAMACATVICEKFEAISKSYDENKAFIYAMNAKCENYQYELNEENKRLQRICEDLQNEINELKRIKHDNP